MKHQRWVNSRAEPKRREYAPSRRALAAANEAPSSLVAPLSRAGAPGPAARRRARRVRVCGRFLFPAPPPVPARRCREQFVLVSSFTTDVIPLGGGEVSSEDSTSEMTLSTQTIAFCTRTTRSLQRRGLARWRFAALRCPGERESGVRASAVVNHAFQADWEGASSCSAAAAAPCAAPPAPRP